MCALTLTGKLAHSRVQSVTDNLRTQQSQSLKHIVIHKSGYDIKTFKSANEAKHYGISVWPRVYRRCPCVHTHCWASSAALLALPSSKAIKLSNWYWDMPQGMSKVPSTSTDGSEEGELRGDRKGRERGQEEEGEGQTSTRLALSRPQRKNEQGMIQLRTAPQC